MTKLQAPQNLRNFIIIWFGQLISNIGSYMTYFAIKIWAWQLTNQVTTIALISFFELIPSIFITLASGLIVDRVNRKFLLIIADCVAAISTIIIGYLYLTDQLQIWHIYATGAVNGAFSEVQALAYSSSISMLVPKQHYQRATSMNSAIHYGSVIIAPAAAGFLYYIINLDGILLIDFITFTIAIATILKVRIPQPKITTQSEKSIRIWQEIIFGFRYLVRNPSLLAVIAFGSLFWFAHDIGATLYSTMILARTNNDTRILGSISSAAGLGGVMGTVILSIWGGSKRRIHGFLLGMMGAGVSKTIFGLGQGLIIWLPAQFCSSLNFPMLSSSSKSILLSKVRPDLQGRVFASESVIQQIVSAIAVFISALLADHVFEPAMMPGGNLVPLFGNLFGTGKGAGMAILYVISSISLLLIGLSGYFVPQLRNVETIVPDSNTEDD
ncbi:Major Facilitator Superfamily transporter [Rivularia sp. PCC 7116]|uniref:MFS transporter n=1 Tax=Rivularia sp. PCC 7116 TaxID=373994 RepID=UPI00029F0ED8|nr:MFS transporter [Rivularia sp. PCC 7116]AFY58534.1 Major Facilitator Superfamily transporter [Rivularia sp. PCC 7116]